MSGGNAKSYKNKPFWVSNRDNSVLFVHYYDWLTELCISEFEWHNLPDTVDERYLELALYSSGQAIFFKDDVLGYMGLRCIVQGNFNPYGIPKNRRAFGYNTYQKVCDDTDSVIIYNNALRKPTQFIMEEYAVRIADYIRTIDVNVKAQKTPVLITCEEGQKLTMQTVYQKYIGNEPVIYGRKGLDKDSITVMSTEAPFVSDKMYALKTEIWNEVLTYLGIPNVNSNKKERLITDEVNESMGAAISSKYSRLMMRQKACKEINKMFGLNIDVSFRKEIEDMFTTMPDIEELTDKEGEENE